MTHIKKDRYLQTIRLCLVEKHALHMFALPIYLQTAGILLFGSE